MSRLGRTWSVTLTGLRGALVAVEADVAASLPAILIVGLPDAACRQAAERVRAAVTHSEYPRLECRVVVNLSPASLPKAGAGFDLAIALAILAARGDLPEGIRDDIVHLGELGLDGSVRPVPGVLPLVAGAVRAGHGTVMVPFANAGEAALVSGARVYAVRSLTEAVVIHRALVRGEDVPCWQGPADPAGQAGPVRDLADVAGQDEARFAIEVATAGGHHVFMAGPPGAGKTMLAECLPGLLPPLTGAESLEATTVHSVLGVLPDGSLIRRPPFVAPHHSASGPALIGGGGGPGLAGPRPGLVTLAHHGVLFLDEAPEFKRGVLQALRQPLESGQITVARARGSVTYPARFQLVLAANPCPCGGAGGTRRRCTCASRERRDYLARLAGPLLDRVDVQLAVEPVSRVALAGPPREGTALVAERVARARAVQAERLAATGWTLNAQVPGPRLRTGPFALPPGTTAECDRALDLGVLTLRGYDRVLRVAWSIADLAGRTVPGRDEVGLALTLRTRAGAAA